MRRFPRNDDCFTFVDSLTLFGAPGYRNLCGKTDEQVNSDGKPYNNAREFSKVLSDYMLYLLALKPTVMNFPESVTKIILKGLRNDASKYFHERSLKQSSVRKASEIFHQGRLYPSESESRLIRGAIDLGR